MAHLLDLIGMDELCDRIEAGDSFAAISADYAVSPMTLRAYLRATPEREADYARAIEASAEALLEKGREIIASSLNKKGDIDPTAARALASEYARLAAIRNRAFSDKPQVAIQINNNPQPLQLPDNLDPIAASKAYAALIDQK